MRSTKAISALILLTAGAGLLAGCSGGPSGAGTSGGSAALPPAHGEPAANGAGSAASSSGNSAGRAKSAAAGSAGAGQASGTGARVANAGAIDYTAELTVRTARVNAAAAAAAGITSAAGGYVSSEMLSSATGAPADLQLKIPVAVYPATLSRLAGLGTQVSLSRQAQNLTEQVADVSSQVTSDQAAIAQLRALLLHAGSVGDLLTVQDQISTEESSLESIEAQQRALSDETSYATVTMTIVAPKAKAKPAVTKPHKSAPPPGLMHGLSAGWHALRVTMDWTLALLGALAPFAAIAALLAFAGYRGRRWLLRRRAA